MTGMSKSKTTSEWNWT